MKKIATLLAALMLMTAALAGCGDTGYSSTSDTQRFFTASQSSTVEDSSAAEGEDPARLPPPRPASSPPLKRAS